jgi:hypothetical protein
LQDQLKSVAGDHAIDTRTGPERDAYLLAA